MEKYKNFIRCIEKWGKKASLADCRGGIIQNEKCFIQPLRYKNKMYIEGTPTEIGINDSGYYLLIGPPNLKMDRIGKKGCIRDGEKKYHVDRWEKIYAGEDVFYIWAVLKEYTDGCYPVYEHFR